MVKVRLFAQARELAGVGVATFAGETVADVLNQAKTKFGPQFESVLQISKVWLNGKPTDGSVPVSEKRRSRYSSTRVGRVMLNKPAAPGSRRERRESKERRKAQDRELRWSKSRLAVPYRTDGPKVSLGILWFSVITGAAILGPVSDNPTLSAVTVASVASLVAAFAGLQTARAWFGQVSAPRGWAAAAAYVTGIAGFMGPLGVPLGVAAGCVIIVMYILLYRGHQRSQGELFDVLFRSSIPIGLAASSMAALGHIQILIALIALVSAYEMGDFIVGSGAASALEGPLAGFLSMSAVIFILYLARPAPFDGPTALLFGGLTAVCCPLGQILASGLLPTGSAQAPALRRLDSYLLAAPLWLALFVQSGVA